MRTSLLALKPRVGALLNRLNDAACGCRRFCHRARAWRDSELLIPRDAAVAADQGDSNTVLRLELKLRQHARGGSVHDVEGEPRLFALPQLERIDRLFDERLEGADREDVDELVLSLQRETQRPGDAQPIVGRVLLQAGKLLAQRRELIVEVQRLESP